MKKLLKTLCICIMCVICLFLPACDVVDVLFSDIPPEKTTKECYLYETMSFDNGVTFKVTDYIYKDELKVGYNKYVTEDIFLCLRISIYNGSNETLSLSGSDIFFKYGDVKISQVDIVKRYADGYYDINQSASTTKTYFAIFDLSKNIALNDLVLWIYGSETVNPDNIKMYFKQREG